jgi:hypothetical protein
MTPVDQLLMAEWGPDGKQTQWGDCMRAVFASLLDLPITDVPHFLLDQVQGRFDDAWDSVDAFLSVRGYAFLRMNWLAFQDHAHLLSAADLYHYMAGPSPRGRGIWHAVVGKNGEVEFDPHPARTGLAGDPKDWLIGILVKTCQRPDQKNIRQRSREARRAARVANP